MASVLGPKKVFLSYSRHDATTAQSLVADIERLDCSVWIDTDLIGGERWWDTILEKIRECDFFVYALTLTSWDSVACTRERNYALALKKPVLTVLLSDDASPALLPDEFSTTQTIDYRVHNRSSALDLARAITHVPAAPQLPNPLPPPPVAPLSPLRDLATRLSQPEPLSENEQRGAWSALQDSIGNSATAADARLLLARLRRRREVLRDIAAAADRLLADESHLLNETEPEGKKNGDESTGHRQKGVAKPRGKLNLSVSFRKFALAFSATFALLLLGAYVTHQYSATPTSTTLGSAGAPTVGGTAAPPATDIWANVPPGLKDAVGTSGTRARFDFDGDGKNEDCRIVTGSTSYYVCSSEVRVYFGVIEDVGLADWPRDWIDWDGDGRNDWCRIVSVAGGRAVRCSFGDGRSLDQTITSHALDAGYPYSDVRKDPAFEFRNGGWHFCRTTGSHDFDQYRPCLAAKGRGFGDDTNT